MKLLCLFKGGRKDRIEMISRGKAPKDFFYGALDISTKALRLFLAHQT